MSVVINIHKTHRPYTDGLAIILVDGETINKCLDNLISHYPEMYTALFQAPYKLKNNIEIYLNMETAYPDELSRKVNNGDEIHITVMLAGG